MLIRITFKYWRKFKNERMMRDAECVLNFDFHQEDTQAKKYDLTKRKASQKMVRKIFPNFDIVKNKPHK